MDIEGSEVAVRLADVAAQFWRRGWMLGTSGNLSAVIRPSPLTLAITPSGGDKGALAAADILEVDATGAPAGRVSVRPSAETRLHLTVADHTGAGAVFHTHSVWGTLVSEHDGVAVWLEGYEMLKGLSGVTTHEHRECVPILENSQDMDDLAGRMRTMFAERSGLHGFLVRRHGLYTWGRDISEATRHAEILEFLLEVRGRTS
jgi:methylthioribulose-1-phosphate dehydratase